MYTINITRVGPLIVIFFFFSFFLVGQNPIEKHFLNYYGFGKYLFSENDYKRAISQLKAALFLHEFFVTNKNDSIYYLIGISYSKISDYGLSNRYLAYVSNKDSNLYEKSLFQSGKNYILNNNIDSALFFCQYFSKGVLSKKYSENMTLLLASSYLLMNNAKSASQELKNADLTVSKLYDYSTELKNFKSKSPLLAGTLSAIVPGTGKFYTKNIEHGLLSLFVNGLLGYRTVVEYKTGGPGSSGFIIFGTIFLITYTANILGSVISAKHYNEKYYNDIHSKVIGFVNELD